MNFITSFIFEGDFEDPFNEFYIEKINNNPDDMQIDGTESKIKDKILTAKVPKFKMRLEKEYSLPIFISRFSVQIFKCGSMLSLLKDIEDSEYFSICGNNHIYLDLPNFYYQNGINLSEYYHNQCEKLLDLENEITDDEVYQMALRKKIKRNYEEFQKKINDERQTSKKLFRD